MPNAPKTKVRTVRIPDDIWNDAQEMAAYMNTDVSTYIRADLERRVKQWRKRTHPRPT